MNEDRKERGRKVRKKLRDTIPTCIVAVDHGDYIGAYFYPEDMEEAHKLVAAGEWDGFVVKVKQIPPITMR
jgi:hypothetical protein